ncbi:MAG TPA: SMP-30/gluconolactonase/LRE family protein [Steroidobacteraceae bacterium]|nr:SMP-30/gluconolactonase/LRE family protein [Steroidobacteraceae bacterium]
MFARTLFNTLILALATSLPATALAQKVTRLTPQDRIEIQELTDGYTYKIDNCTNSGYDYADMYTDDATFGVASEWGGGNVKVWYRGREELAVAAGGGKDGCKPKPKVSGVQVHHIATSLVVTPTATGAHGKSTLLATGVGGNPVAIEWQGGYEDEYVKTPKGWKFKSRVHVWPGYDWPDTAAGMAARRAAASAVPPAGPVKPQMRGDGPPPEAKDFSITRADPALDALIAPNTKAQLMANGFGLNEGPVWIPRGLHGNESGYLLVGGLLDNVIYKITQDNRVSVFLDNAGYTGDDVNNTGTQTRSGRSHVLLIGPSCASLDSQGRLVWCADNDRAVMRLEKDGKTRTLLANGSGGKRFSGPNDIVIRSDDAVFLTDNDFGLRGAGKSPLKELPNGIWMIKDGTARMVLDDKALGGIPNGIALSPDERYLYLTAGRKLKRYELHADGTLGNSMLFAEGDGIGDGIKVDVKGNVFSSGGAGPGIIRVTAPDGRFLGLLNLPIYGGEPKKQICATNIAFGGDDARTLFVAACDAVYKIQTKTTGLMPGPKT